MISTYIYLFSAFNILLAIVMLLFNYKLNKNIFYLAGFIFLYSFENSMQSYFVFGGDPVLYPYLFNNLNFIYFFKAPFLYFFIRGLVKEKFYFDKKDSLHFLPAIIRLLSNIPYYLTPFAYKQDVALKVLNDMENYKYIDLLNWYPNSWTNIFRALQLFIYIVAAFVLLAKSRKLQNRENYIAQTQYHYVTIWIKILLIIILMLSIIHIVTGFIYTLTDNSKFTSNLIGVLVYFAIYVYFAIPVYVLLNPRFLYGFTDYKPGNVPSPIDVFFNGKFAELKKSTSRKKPEKAIEHLHPKKEILKIEDDLGDESVTEVKKYQDLDMEELANKIMLYLEESKIYLNVNFQVKDICVALKVPQHHVQFCLNEILGKKFSDIKNEFRIQYAMDLFNTQSSELSVEGVGHMSGFASNSNFYTAFKQYTGLTPNQWLKQREI